MNNINVDQIQAIIRWLLSVGGPLTAFLISRGMTPDQISGLQIALLAITGALPPLISLIWGIFRQTDNEKLKAVEKMPEVRQIVIASSDTNRGQADLTAAESAAGDVSRPKVVTQ